MKRLLILLAFVLTLGTVMSQGTVTLTFTGKKVDGSYNRLSFVKVESLSRGWTEILVYPDTVLELTATVGIEMAEESSMSLESFPNPFKCSTVVNLQMAQSDNVSLQIFDLSGRKVAESSRYLTSGSHSFQVSLQKAQVYLLVARSSQGRSTLKLLNQSSGDANAISYGGKAYMIEKGVSTEHFERGDFMRYTGYTVNGTDTLGSNPLSQAQSIDATVTLVFGDRAVVATEPVTNITGTTAESGGEVISDGGTVVYYRGVCWSTRQNPTIYDSCTADGTGLGTFSSSLTNLTPGTTYYLRAYATNTAGTSYGGQETFVTPDIPVVTTAQISNVGVSTASCGGNVTSDGGAAVTSRGVCWSTSPNPTIADNNTSDSSGAGAFVSAITGLTTGTTYYVRAYATNIVGTGYGNQVSFTTQQLPILTTDTVMNIIDTSATFSGTIVAFGDATATVRGFCWGNSPDPDITTDSFSVDVNCTLGAFSQQVTTLVGGSIYYVRAYATSSLGTGYGQNVLFYTLGTPVVVADSVSGITTTTATYYGHVAFHGGDSVTSRGFCWSTFPNPTTADNVVTSGSGMGSFISNVAQLNPGTVYYVRAFATNMYGTGYSDNVVFSTVNPAFSVTPLRKIGFSTGNLQWSATGGGNAATSHVVAGGDTAAGTWRFATHQYDTIGTANSNISSSYNGWIDLFGWGTSGYDQRYPYLNTTSIYAYDNGNTDMSGTNYDWGTYNAILNGGNQPGQWFTLTKEEWEYLLNDREGASQKRGFATVCGVPGALLLPDSWSHPVGTSFVTGNGNGYATNTYNASQWAVMESYGAIFLPAAGYRYDSTAVQGVGAFGHYWTASADSATITYCLKLSPDRVDIEGYRNTQGKSVRLVRILSERPKVTTDSITSVTSNSVVIYGNILSTGRDSVTLCGFCWSTNPNPTTSDNVSSFFPNSPAVGSYSRNITNLVSGTKYYVRFFATNGDGISYGNEQIFTTTGYGISGRFSVSATTKVRIAHGNLQYTGWGTHLDFDGDTMRGRWQFAYNHYDKLGVAPNALISDTNSGSIDLFGWGTSGFQRMPTLSDVADSLYGNDSADIAYSRHDWGVNNQIYSMLRDEFYAPDTWRTLSLAEIDYLFVQRPSASSKVGLAMISGVNGLIILPDDWQQPSGINFVPTCAYGYAINTYTPSQWEMMADNGAVFLPAAGFRDGVTVTNVNDNGVYWSATANGVDKAGFVTFSSNNLIFGIGTPLNRHIGVAVRLVMDEPNW